MMSIRLMARIFWKIVALGCLASTASVLQAQEVSTVSLFADSAFDRWAAEEPVMQIPWKVHASSRGLSQHQRLVAQVEIEIKDRELVKRADDGRLVALVRVTDEAGNRYRDFGVIDLKEIQPGKHSRTWSSLWNAFVLPGEYKVAVALYDKASGEHSFQRSTLHVSALKNDPLPDAWAGLPAWEFWAPITDTRDAIFHSDIMERLHLPLRTKRPVQLEILADLTPSDLFHGSPRFYTRYLSVMLPLLKTLNQITPSNGSVEVATVDLRQKRVTFEQGGARRLDWARLKAVTNPENGPGTIAVNSLRQTHETPDFLRYELLQRLRDARSSNSGQPPLHMIRDARSSNPGQPPLHVIVVLGSPMDFYDFHHFPPLDAELADNCVIYYLQFETYGHYANGALGKVRSMLRPLPIRTFKVRSAESVRDALAAILEEVPRM